MICFDIARNYLVMARTPQVVQVYEVHQEICSASIEYPEYYLQTFHTYDEGNLGWLPAFEAEAATDVVAIRAFKDDILTPIQAQQKLRSNIHNAIQVTVCI